MAYDFMGIFNPLMNSFLRPRTIRRIDDGRRVDQTKQKSLQGLPEQTLRDLGYTSTSC